jgi:nucleoside-diphosphate-sugar epimerase
MKRILITGSLGYFGSMLSGYLAELGYDCIGFDTGFFRDSLLYPPEETKTVIKDVRDMNEADLKDVDVVVHLAGISNDPMGSLDAASIYDPTRDYSLKIAILCKKMGVRFIFASSCSVYGIGEHKYLTEDSKTNPQTYYSLNKLQIEEDLASISDQTFSPIALRFATIFGLSARIRFDVVINMLVGMAISKKEIVLNSDGKAWRPNLHIRDACEAVLCAIELKYDAPELMVLNVGDDESNLQVLKISELLQQLVPDCELQFLLKNPELDKEGLILDRKINHGSDKRSYKVSFKKIKCLMPSFKIKWSVEKGIQNMVEGLIKLSFDYETFKRRDFYRLQRLEDLYNERKISNELRWTEI